MTGLFARRQTLTKAEIEQNTAPYRTGQEVDAVLDRRDAIVDHFTGLIEDKGESRVFYE